MDKNQIKQQLFGINEAMLAFLDVFSKFRQISIVNSDISHNIRCIYKNISDYMESDFKICTINYNRKWGYITNDNWEDMLETLNELNNNEFEIISIPKVNLLENLSIENQNQANDTQNKTANTEELKLNEDVEKCNKTEEKLKKTISDDFFDKPSISKSKGSTSKQTCKIDQILNENHIISIPVQITICKICENPFDRTLFEDHIKIKHLIITQSYQKYIKSINELRRFYCKLCKKNIGYEDDILVHVKDSEHLGKFDQNQLKFDENQLKFDQNQLKFKEDNISKAALNVSQISFDKLKEHYIVICKQSWKSCKICHRQIRKTIPCLKQHLISHGKIWINKSDYDILNGYNLIETKFYRCEICGKDLGMITNESNINLHISSNKMHLKLLNQMKKNLNLIYQNNNIENYNIDNIKSIGDFALYVNNEITFSNSNLLQINQIQKSLENNVTVYSCGLCECEIGFKNKLLHHLLNTEHVEKLLKYEGEKYNVAGVVVNFEIFLSKIQKEISSSSNLNDKKFLKRHQIQKHSRRVLECGLCKMHIGAINKLSIHLLGKSHIRKLYNYELSSNGKQFNDTELNNNKICEKETLLKYLNEKISFFEKLKNINEIEGACKTIKNILSNIYPNIKTYSYGMHNLDLGDYNSGEIIIFIDTDNNYYKFEINSDDILPKVEFIKEHLNLNCEQWKNLKYYDDKSILCGNYNNDINNYILTFTNGMRHSKMMLLSCMFEKQPLCKQLCIIFIQIFKDINLIEHFDVYTIIIMVIFYLQINNYLPSVKQLQEDDNYCKKKKIGPWVTGFIDAGCNNLSKDSTKIDKTEIIDLIKELLIFYSIVMDYDNEIICPYIGRQIQKSYLDPPSDEFKSLEEFYEIYGEQFKLVQDCSICIQDPIELNLNITQNISKDIMNTFTEKLENYYDSIEW